MLTKLLKYDLKYMIKNMAVFYLLSVFFAITTRILFQMDQSVMVGILAQISVGCLFAMIINTLINTMMRSWVRFRDSLYKDEAYLTHTLPVPKSALYDSKFIQTLIFFFIGFAVILCSLFIAYFSKDAWLALSNFIKAITSGLNMSTLLFVIMAVLLVFLEVFNAIQCGFLGMILGHKKNSGKLGYSVFFGFLFYLVSQALVLALTFLYGLFDPTVMTLFKTDAVQIDANAFKSLAVVASVLYLAIILGMRTVCKKLLNKGVDIE